MNNAKIFKGKRILVVDDQKFIRGMVSQSLKSLGFDAVHEAADGFAAIQLLGGGEDSESFSGLLKSRPDISKDVLRVKQTLDCVITDIRMSPMNGLELLKAIRCGVAGSSRDLPVLVMSAHADEELIGAAIALDANAFIVKPASQAAIAEKVARSLSLKLPLKPKEAYSGLFVPEVDERHFQFMDASVAQAAVATIRAMDVATLKGQVAVELPIGDLKVDDVLTENIVSESGAVIVPAGTTVKEGLLNALLDLSSMAKLPATVKVKRKAM